MRVGREAFTIWVGNIDQKEERLNIKHVVQLSSNLCAFMENLVDKFYANAQ